MAGRSHLLAFTEVGRGRPLLLLHGWATSGRALDPLALSLSDSARVILPDLRGHGRSAPPPGPFSLLDHGEDVARLARELALERPVLAGWSFGAQAALAAAARLEAEGIAVAGLALLAATERFASEDGYPHGLSAAQIQGLAARLAIHPGKALSRFFAACFAKDELSDVDRERALARLGAEPPDLGAALGALKALSDADLRPLTPRIAAPVLLLHGEEDAIVPAGASQVLAAALANARRFTYPGVGHAPFVSRAAEVARAVGSFLAELP